jgi:hypothetical protein
LEGIDGADGRSVIRRIFEKVKFAAFLEIRGFFGNSRLFWKFTAFLEIHGFFGNARLFWKCTAFLEIHGFFGKSRLFWKFAAFLEIHGFFGKSRLFWKFTAFLEIHGFSGNSRLFWKITAFLEIRGFCGNFSFSNILCTALPPSAPSIPSNNSPVKFAAFVEISVFQISSVQRFRRPPRRYLPITRP